MALGLLVGAAAFFAVGFFAAGTGNDLHQNRSSKETMNKEEVQSKQGDEYDYSWAMQGVNKSQIRWLGPRQKSKRFQKNIHYHLDLSKLWMETLSEMTRCWSRWSSLPFYSHTTTCDKLFCVPGSIWKRSAKSPTWLVLREMKSWQGNPIQVPILKMKHPIQVKPPHPCCPILITFPLQYSNKLESKLSWIATEWEISGLDSVRLEGYRVLLDYPDPASIVWFS